MSKVSEAVGRICTRSEGHSAMLFRFLLCLTPEPHLSISTLPKTLSKSGWFLYLSPYYIRSERTNLSLRACLEIPEVE